ncbi:hypothetical protein B296_00054789 [Ensete ventricosum]|uniref:Uncharacterized protein n=1 Tax=Ensete ventricosum TaxID=4639 RepID=A0A426X4K6_ENSVE|nr:hypothetical protein B296_00054789 [Ensete ventricosum]
MVNGSSSTSASGCREQKRAKATRYPYSYVTRPILFRPSLKPRDSLYWTTDCLGSSPRQLGSGALQVLHGLQQLVVHLPSPDSRLLQQPLDLLASLPLGLLELLSQLGRVLLGLGDRLRTLFGF